MDAKKEKPGEERRRYIRLDTVFPVEFRLVSPDKEKFLSDWLQGFTNNLSKGGICLEVNNLKDELAALIKNQQARISLNIAMPIGGKPVQAVARIAWIKEADAQLHKYLIGLSYEEIDPRQNSKMMRYARAKKLFVPAVFF
ncbi:PilZ domain-containing protein [bacterium]|nr:MAG: PilZ domain-containing protein [bacterium]